MANQTIKILTINNKQEEKILRRKTAEFNFSAFGKKEISDLIKRMEEIMIKSNGVGLSANQIGLDLKLFVAHLPTEMFANRTRSDTDNISVNQRVNQRQSASINFMKSYTIFNPEIIKFSKERISIEEGCLSVPELYGEVERPEKITLVGLDKNGKKLKIKAWGLLARIFQHEVDHLNGVLFIDKAKNIHKISEIPNTPPGGETRSKFLSGKIQIPNKFQNKR